VIDTLPLTPGARPDLDPQNASAPARRRLNEVPSFDSRFSPTGLLPAIMIDLRWNPMRAAWRTSLGAGLFKPVHVKSLPAHAVRSLITIHDA
jgi:hypothetical protein